RSEFPVPSNGPVVSGDIFLGPGTRPLASTTIYIRLEEVSRADAHSRTVAEKVLHGVSLEENSAFPFELHAEIVGPESHLNVRVHVDVDGDGQVSSGDYITTESYPVRTRGSAARLQIRVHQI